MPPVRFLISFFPIALISAIFILGGRARAGDASTQPTDPITEARRTDVILADVFGDVTQDPFSSEKAPEPTNQWGDQRGNNGNAHVTLDFAYANRYVYRGVNQDAVSTHGNSLNLLFDGKLEFDLGQYPHPFVELFTNVYDADPQSRFQEVRPILGLDWDVKPFDIELAHISYIYPERESFNYPEIDLKVTLDDYLLFNTEKPVISPYVLAAYEYQKNEGWYLEFGIKHDFFFEEIGLTVTPKFDVGWISGLKQQFVFINEEKNTGWQHLEVGLEITYSLNVLLNVSKRFGEFDIKGYGFYDDKLNENATAFTGTWGGIGLGFKY
jgi:hypothetical protein